MWYIVVFVAITLTLVEAASIQEVKKCLVLKEANSWKCCKPEIPPGNRRNSTPESTYREEIFKECMKLPTDNCERDNCFGFKRGFLTPDGKLDKKTTQEWFKNQISSVMMSTEITNNIVNNCVVGDLAIFGQPDNCEFNNFRLCVDLQAMINCPKWSTDSPCEDTIKLADECSKLFV